MNAQEVGTIIRAQGVKFNTAFFDPPYPKFWRYSYGNDAEFIIYYEPDTHWAVARGGFHGWKSVETYYIGQVHSYKHLFHDISKTEYAAIEQQTKRKTNYGAWIWQEPVVLRHKEDTPERLMSQIMKHLTDRTGAPGFPFLL